MRKTIIATGLVAATMLGMAGPANAKPIQLPIDTSIAVKAEQVHHRRHILPRRAVIRSLYKRGYRNVHNVHFHRGYWRARAFGRRGVVALTIHPRNGKIISRHVVRHYGHRKGHRGYYRHHNRGGLTFSFGFH